MALERVKQTSPQVGLSRSQRAANLAGAFRVDEARAGRIAGGATGAGGRRADHRGHRQRRRQGSAQGRRNPRRSAGFRQGRDSAVICCIRGASGTCGFAMAHIVVYTTATCPYCLAAKSLLEKEGGL